MKKQKQKQKQKQKVAVLGASNKPQRYSNKAVKLLLEYGHEVFPVHPVLKEIEGCKCYVQLKDIPEHLDTITLYVGKVRSNELISEIIMAQSDRLIINPGAENATLKQAAQDNDITVIEACTLVMLRTGQFDTSVNS